MSRTYRRKSGAIPYWVTSECVNIPGTWSWEWVPIDPKSKQGIEKLARYHADNTVLFKEPGPAWFRNVFTERPQRREGKRQLKLYMQDPDYEVILNPKDPLEYWT